MYSEIVTSFFHAQATSAALPQPSLGEVFMQMLPMFTIVFFIFYFMVIRPQNKKMLDQENLLKSLKKGDSVVTASGIVGKVASVEEKFVTLEIAPNVKVKMVQSSIQSRDEDKK